MALSEKTVRQEIYRLLRTLGYWPITQTDSSQCYNCHTVIKPPIGRPDILVLHPTGMNLVIEVKVIGKNQTSFPFQNITPEQRRWLDAWTEQGGKGFLALGTLVPRQRRTWLVEWTAWRQLVEEVVMPHQQSVPVVAGKGINQQLQQQKLDLHNLIKEWELRRANGAWQLPTTLEDTLCQRLCSP